MGGEYSSQYGGMFIQTDLPYCISGTVVTGKIYVQINQQYPAYKLKLKIKGKEKWKWYEQKSREMRDGDRVWTEWYEDKHDEDHNVFEYEDNIYKFSVGYIPPGQYVFPFSFVLPHDCPSTAYFTGDQKATASIKYKCKGVFEAQDHTPFKDIKYKCKLVVRQVPSQVYANLSCEQDKEIYKWWCCCSQGVTRLRALFEKNAYTSVEVARALISINNWDCSAKVNSIVFQLKQIVRLSTDHHNYLRTYKILSKNFPGLEPNEQIENKELQINLAESKQTYQRYDGEKKLDQDEIQLAEFIQPTTSGRWLNIQYQLEIKQKFEGTCCSDNPHCSLAMFLQPPYLPSYGQMAAPNDWDPVIYDPREVIRSYFLINVLYLATKISRYLYLFFMMH